MGTTIRLESETKSQLDLFREYKNESYDEIIRKLVFVAKSAGENSVKAKELVDNIGLVRENLKNSGRYSKEEVRKILGK